MGGLLAKGVEHQAELAKDKQRMEEDWAKQDNTWVTLQKRRKGGLFWTVLFYLQVSRPFLWLATLYLYCISTICLHFELIFTWTWWVGFFYMGWPVNFLQFAPNDYSDLENDRLNPRKRSFWTGGHYTRAELDTFPMMVVWSQVPFFIACYLLEGWGSVMYLGFAVFINVVYNLPSKKYAWRNIPILELFGVLGFVPATPFAAQLNGVEHVGLKTIVPLCLFCVQLQLWGEVWDNESDKKAGRTNTTNSVIGMFWAKMALNAICFFEGVWMIVSYDDWVLGIWGIVVTILQLNGWRGPRKEQFKIHVCTINEYAFVFYSIWFFLRTPFLTFRAS